MIVQYSQRHSVIDVSLLLMIQIYLLFCLIYLLILICLLGDSKQHSKCKRNFNTLQTKRYIQITKNLGRDNKCEGPGGSMS